MAAPTAESRIQVVAGHADAVLERCADRYSGLGTPMLADHLDLTTGEPQRWEGRTLSNLARQQHFLRVLAGLDALGESRFGNAARSWIEHALPALTDEGGLLYWGGHSTYALDEDAPLPGNHELKCVYPFYDYLYRVDPERTRRFVEAFWQRHVWDWSSLLFNRHGDYGPWDRSRVWEEAEFRGGPLPIVEQTALSFINTGSDLIYAAAELFRLHGEERALRWAANLVSRYDQVRHPRTGLGAYQFNHREPMLEMTAALAGAMGWTGKGGAVPVPAAGEPTPDPTSAVFGLLDLHEATGEPAYLEGAASLGQALAAERTRDGMLAGDPAAAGAASQDNILALALLHCAAARDGRRGLMPPYYPGGNPWDPKIVVRTILGRV